MDAEAREELSDVKSAVGYVSCLQRQSLALAQGNYKFNRNGTITTQTGMSIYRLAVTAGRKYLVNVLANSNANIYYSVQNTSGLSASDTTRVLETGAIPGIQIVTIPSEGKYLFINCTSDDTESGVFLSDTVEGVAANTEAITSLREYTDGRLDVIGDSIFEKIAVPLYQSTDGWRLNESNGLCSQNSAYSLIKYAVKAGYIYRIVCDDRWQFQSSSSVPSSGDPKRIGETYGTGTFTVVAPVGATYLIISTPTATSSVSVNYLESLTDEANQKIDYVGNFKHISGSLAQSGYKFKANGTITTDSHFNIYRYSVTPDSDVLMYNKNQNGNVNCYATIQNTSGLSASDTTRVLLTIEKVGYSIVHVPADGRYLFYTCDTADAISGIYKSSIVDTVNELAEKILVPDIVLNNADVLPSVNAACYYGVNRNGTANYKKQYALLVTTDVHGFTARMNAAVDYLNSTQSIDAGICLGDMAAGNFTDPYEWYITAVERSDKNWYTVIGNHDCGNGQAISQNATKAQVFSRWIESTRDKMGLPDLATTYYAFSADTGVTFIVLDCYDGPDTLDGSGDFVVSRGVVAYSQAQIDWLISALAAVPANNSVVVVTHTLSDPMTPDAGAWTQPNAAYSTELNYHDLIPDIINAWVGKTTLSSSYAPVTTGLPTITVNADFSARTNSRFMCYLMGHEHKDLIGHVAKYANQKIVCLAATAAGNYQNGNSDLPRAEGTKAIDCITVFVVDTTTNTVRLVRIGSNVTTALTDRTKFVMS